MDLLYLFNVIWNRQNIRLAKGNAALCSEGCSHIPIYCWVSPGPSAPVAKVPGTSYDYTLLPSHSPSTQRPPFRHVDCVQSSILTSQNCPAVPVTQWHWKPSSVSSHVPPYKHGKLAQESWFSAQFWPPFMFCKYTDHEIIADSILWANWAESFICLQQNINVGLVSGERYIELSSPFGGG